MSQRRRTKCVSAFFHSGVSRHDIVVAIKFFASYACRIFSIRWSHYFEFTNMQARLSSVLMLR